MDLEDRAAALDVGQADVDLAVEAAGPQDSRIDHVEAVRGRNHDDVIRR